MVTSSPGAATITREVQADQNFNLSAEFNRRLGKSFVLSAELVEGKSGGGVECRVPENRIRVGTRAYDFSKHYGKLNSRHRLITSFQIWKGLHGQAGIEDLANAEFRSLPVGGGIRRKNGSLKKPTGLIGAVPK